MLEKGPDQNIKDLLKRIPHTSFASYNCLYKSLPQQHAENHCWVRFWEFPINEMEIGKKIKSISILVTMSWRNRNVRKNPSFFQRERVREK